MASSIARIPAQSALKLLKNVPQAIQELKKVDPSDRYCLIMPDSTRAFVGMGFKLLNIPEAEEVYNKSSEILKEDILKLCLQGPHSDLLDSLENRYIATYVTTQATIAKLFSEKPSIKPFCKIACGIGIGFINGLVFVGSMSFEDGLELVQYQGRAMDRASKVIPSARLKIRIKPATSKFKLCRAAQEHCIKIGIPPEAAICSITRQIRPHWIEVGGHEEAIKYLETEGLRLFEFYTIQRVRQTPQAIHTRLMMPAQVFLEGYIENKLTENPDYLKSADNFTLLSSTSGHRLRAMETIKWDLIRSPTSSVKTHQMFQAAFSRSKDLSQPNIFSLWDKNVINDLRMVNRRAAIKTKLVEA